jgi:hypothetical protein
MTRRDVLKVHPAADLFPPMSATELQELGEDIKNNGLRSRVVFWAAEPGAERLLLDGRNRLDAMELAGLPTDNVQQTTWYGSQRVDPVAYALSANLHRRHLTAEQRRDLIAKVLKAQPEKSNSSIAKQVKADDKTVASVRREMERRSEIPNAETRTDTKGRKQPARKHKATEESTVKPDSKSKSGSESGSKSRWQPKHRCWQCGVRAVVGEVQEHAYEAYEGIDVWLHAACVADFERKIEERGRSARDDICEASTNEIERLQTRVDELQAQVRQRDIRIVELESEVEELKAKLAELTGKRTAADDGFDFPPFLGRRGPVQ